MSVNSMGNAFAAAQVQAVRQAPQAEQVAAAAVASANHMKPEQLGNEGGNDKPRTVAVSHRGQVIDVLA